MTAVVESDFIMNDDGNAEFSGEISDIINGLDVTGVDDLDLSQFFE